MGQASLYSMLFYILLNWISSVSVTYQVFLWNCYNAFYGDWLYIKESYFILFAIVVEGALLMLSLYYHITIESYPDWCNQDTNPHVWLNQTCNVLEEEDRGVYVHAIILMSFAVIPVLINFVPKWIVMCCCKNVNDMRHRYVRKKYPEELLSIQVIGLNRDVSTLEDELESHQTENTVISAQFKHRLANLNSQLIVAQTALAKSVRGNVENLVIVSSILVVIIVKIIFLRPFLFCLSFL